MLETIVFVGPAAVLLGFIIYGSFDSWQAIRRAKKPDVIQLEEEVFHLYKVMGEVTRKQSLLIDYLELEYVADAINEEPARFVKKKITYTTLEEPTKKKRGRPKKTS